MLQQPHDIIILIFQIRKLSTERVCHLPQVTQPVTEVARTLVCLVSDSMPKLVSPPALGRTKQLKLWAVGWVLSSLLPPLAP